MGVRDLLLRRPCPRCERAGVRDTTHAERDCPRPATPTAWQGVTEATRGRETEERVAKVTPARATMDRWAKVHEEAARFAAGPFGYFLWVDAQCAMAERPLPSASPWWRWSIGEFYASGKNWGIYLVGRGGGKSTTLEKVAATDSYFTPRHAPPGQVWTWPFVSVGPDDANRRVDGIAAVYRALGLVVIGEEDPEGGKHKDGIKISRAPRGSLQLLDALGNPIKLASIAGTIGNLSGPSTIGLTIDEAAKLHDRSTNANPLAEIITSGSQTSRGRPNWRAIVSSSAWERSGTHFQLVEQGDNEVNFVARIGPHFIDDALRGFEAVAAWEQMRGDLNAAKLIREHARSLTAASPMVPTWVANPTLGNPIEGAAWDGAALASRMLVQALPEKALNGVPRVLFWLRENGSVPLDSAGGADMAEQCRIAAEMSEALGRRFGHAKAPPRAQGEVMKIPGARPGDARYAGPEPRRGTVGGPGWRSTFKI